MKADRAHLLFWLRLAFGVAVVAVAIQVTNPRRVIDALRALPPGAFVLAAVVNALGSIVAPAFITRQTLRAGNVRLGLAELIRINFVMRFYVLVLPHAVTVAMRWYRYRREPGQGWDAATLIVFERVVQFAVITLFGFGFLMAAGAALPVELRVLRPISLVLATLALAGVLAFVSHAGAAAARPALSAVATRAPRFVASRIQRFSEAMAGFQHLSHRGIGTIVAFAVAGHLLFVASAWILARAMTLPVGFVDIAWMRSAVLLLTVLPITVGGIGVREAGFATLLVLYGAERHVALAFPLSLLAIQLLIGAAGAALELLSPGRRGRGADSTPAEGADAAR